MDFVSSLIKTGKFSQKNDFKGNNIVSHTITFLMKKEFDGQRD